MKFKKRSSIAVKISILYALLAIINMAFFSIIVYENQIDLITENSKYLIKERTSQLISELQKFSEELKSQKVFKAGSKKDVINEISGLIGNKLRDKNEENEKNDFVIFTEDGSELYKSNRDIQVTKNDIINGIRAVTSTDFTGKQYYYHVDEDNYEIAFYVPFKIYMLEESILFLKFRVKDFSVKLNELYRLISILVVVIALFHIVFAFILFRFFVRPIQLLHGKSLEISRGDLAARADINRSDEIGSLGEAFNSMADSIQEKIQSLQKHNQRMEFELGMAGDVQQVIFPQVEENDRYRYSVFHRACGKVSGDYYDVFRTGKNGTGFLIVDVSGHGVPAALITMIAKELFIRYAPEIPDPAELFKKINTEVSGILGAYGNDTGMYFTAFYFILDRKNRILFSNAGHTRPYLLRKSGKKISLLKADGSYIGIAEEMNDTFGTKKTKVESGDKIILFTDGISEPRNDKGEQFGEEGIVASIKKSFSKNGDEILQTIIADLSVHTDMNNLKDDATLIVVEIK